MTTIAESGMRTSGFDATRFRVWPFQLAFDAYEKIIIDMASTTSLDFDTLHGLLQIPMMMTEKVKPNVTEAIL
jgi:hypothetical protein